MVPGGALCVTMTGICRMPWWCVVKLGYINATAAVGPARFGSGSGPILFSEVACVGNESTITECDHRSTGGHNCSHKSRCRRCMCEGQSVVRSGVCL